MISEVVTLIKQNKIKQKQNKDVPFGDTSTTQIGEADRDWPEHVGLHVAVDGLRHLVRVFLDEH